MIITHFIFPFTLKSRRFLKALLINKMAVFVAYNTSLCLHI